MLSSCFNRDSAAQDLHFPDGRMTSSSNKTSPRTITFSGIWRPCTHIDSSSICLNSNSQVSAFEFDSSMLSSDVTWPFDWEMGDLLTPFPGFVPIKASTSRRTPVIFTLSVIKINAPYDLIAHALGVISDLVIDCLIFKFNMEIANCLFSYLCELAKYNHTCQIRLQGRSMSDVSNNLTEHLNSQHCKKKGSEKVPMQLCYNSGTI